MGVLIDASILIAQERGRLDLASHLVGRDTEEFLLSVITASELLHGVHRANKPEIRARRSAFVEALLARFPLLPWTSRPPACTRASGRNWRPPVS